MGELSKMILMNLQMKFWNQKNGKKGRRRRLRRKKYTVKDGYKPGENSSDFDEFESGSGSWVTATESSSRDSGPGTNSFLDGLDCQNTTLDADYGLLSMTLNTTYHADHPLFLSNKEELLKTLKDPSLTES